MMKFKLFLFIFLLLFVFTTNSTAQQKEKFTLKTVIIDAGHGGHDSGAVYGKYKEKTIVLNIALKLGDMIKQSYPSVKVIYTRDKDVFVPLNERGKIANKAKGDLFISIHVNSVGNSSSARGVETFTIGLHKNAANLNVAKKENSVITLENGYQQTYEGFNPNEEESYIMFGLGQHAYQRKSLSMSYKVQNKFDKYLPTIDRGMKQAGFLILWSTSMPSILTEVGFISNAQDRKYLCTESGRKTIAKSLFEAFADYKKDVEVVSHYDIQNKQVQPSNEIDNSKGYYNTNETGVYFSAQILVSGVDQPLNDLKFKSVKGNLWMIKSGKWYKYYAGKSKSHEEMLFLQEILIKNGFKDAFIVAFNGDKRINIDEAKKILKIN